MRTQRANLKTENKGTFNKRKNVVQQSTEVWIKVWNRHTAEFNAVLRKEEISSLATIETE